MLLVEVGHSQSSVLLAAVTAAGSTLLSEASDVAFGAANFDDRLFRHFQAEIQQKYKGEVKPGRWALGCESCLKISKKWGWREWMER